MNKFIAKNLVYYPVQSLRSQDVKRLYNQVKQNQLKKLDEINYLRDEKLRKIVKTCYEKGTELTK